MCSGIHASEDRSAETHQKKVRITLSEEPTSQQREKSQIISSQHKPTKKLPARFENCYETLFTMEFEDISVPRRLDETDIDAYKRFCVDF